MPTGYTAKLMQEGQKIEDFMAHCVRAMGVAYSLRDEPMNTPVPESFLPDQYYADHLEEAIIELHRFSIMTEKQAIAWGKKKQKEQLQYYAENSIELAIKNRRLANMYLTIQAWTPPTEEHEGYKRFMLDQLKISIESLGFYSERLERFMGMNPIDFYLDEFDDCLRTIERDEENQEEEIERIESRNQWLKALRESLPQTDEVIR